MQGENNVGWCIRYTGTSESDTGYSPSYGENRLMVCAALPLEPCYPRKTRHHATQELIALRLIRSGTVGFTIKLRVPPRGLNDVNLMERKIS